MKNTSSPLSSIPEPGADGPGSVQAHFSPHHGRGAIGSHAAAANVARRDFRELAKNIVQRIDLGEPCSGFSNGIQAWLELSFETASTEIQHRLLK